jgi:hypothetical protein
MAVYVAVSQVCGNSSPCAAVLIFFCQAYAFYATSPELEIYRSVTQPYFIFDTQEKGKGNQGHTYGTQLSNDDKEKLLEYLETL